MYEPAWRHPQSLREAVSAVDESSRPIAGGTDLAVLIRNGAARPEVLVDLSGVRELRGISIDGSRVELGSLVTHAEVSAHPLLRQRAGLLPSACAGIGSAQTRARGTVGGNVANASPAADSVAALAALDATVHIVSTLGERAAPLLDVMVGPGDTSMAPDELIAGITFDLPRDGVRSCYRKIGQRNALAIAIVSIAAVFDAEAGEVRLAFGSVAPTVVRATVAEELFRSRWRTDSAPEDTVAEVAQAAVQAASPIDDVRAGAPYRSMLVQALTATALTELCMEH